MRKTDLLRKELLTAKNRLPELIVLLILLPAVFAGASLVFEDVIPRDSPVAVVPSDEDVTEDEMNAVTGTLAVFGDPVEMDDLETAERALTREEVYAIVEVPAGFADEGGTFVVHAHGGIVPYEEPSKIMVSVLSSGVDAVGINISIERNVVGDERTLSEFLAPVLLFSLVVVLALTYVPHELQRERRALERLRLETSLVAVVVTKVGFLAALLALPVGVFAAASWYLGYETTFLSPAALVFLLLTFVYLSFVSSAVALATKFNAFGRLVTVMLVFAVFVLSNLIYPAGFFSPLRRRVARALPTHYSSVAYRSHVTKDVPATLFADWFAALVGFTVVAFVALVVAARRYESR